jgi:hypothetical protein
MSQKSVFTISENPRSLLISNGIIGIEFNKPNFGFLGISNALSGGSFSRRERGLGARFSIYGPSTQEARGDLWQANFRDEEGQEAIITNNTPCNCSSTIEKSSDGNKLKVCLSWKNIDLPKEKGKVNVNVFLTVIKSSPLTYWKINIKNRSTKYGLWTITFPQLAYFRANSEDPQNEYLTVPDTWGILVKDPSHAGELFMRPFRHVWGMEPSALDVYPQHGRTMQFLAYYYDECGLYIATHDSRAYVKRLGVYSDSHTGTLTFQIVNYPEDMSIAGNSYQTPYDAVIGIFKGDWYDAAKIYREWALKNAEWCKKGPLSLRDDIPDWLKNNDLWCTPSLDEWGEPDKVVTDVTRFKNFFGVSVALHWYNWFDKPFDITYPDYFPREGFEQGVKKLHDAGVRVLPYMSGRLFNPDSDSWTNEGAERYTAKNVAPRVGRKTLYNYLEAYGPDSKLAVMCPYTKYWQDRYADIIARLAEKYDIDGVYLDQIAAAPPNLCFDSKHGHSLGGGNYWVEGYNKLLENIHNKARSKKHDLVLVTEANAEPYMGNMDGHLTICNCCPELDCNPLKGNIIVPLFPAVYGGYSINFGRFLFREDIDDTVQFVTKLAQMFLFGSQLGWFGLHTHHELLEKNEESADYMKKLAQCRGLARKFLVFGEMLRPPQPNNKLPEISTSWGFTSAGTPHIIKMPAVLASAWRAEDGSVGIISTNVSTSPQPIIYSIDATEYNLPESRSYKVIRILEKEKVEIANFTTSTFTITDIIPSRNVVIFEIIAG